MHKVFSHLRGFELCDSYSYGDSSGNGNGGNYYDDDDYENLTCVPYENGHGDGDFCGFHQGGGSGNGNDSSSEFEYEDGDGESYHIQFLLEEANE
jgi:hypothetical protein